MIAGISTKASRFITKYFDPKDLEHFQAGSVAFGPTSYYRAIESDIAGRTDENDAKLNIETNVEKSHDAIDSVLISIGGAQENTMTNVKESISVQHWIFCACNAPYSRKQHEKMLYGCDRYPGDPRLKGYAIFDTMKFKQAVLKSLSEGRFFFPELPDYTPKQVRNSHINCGKVRYEDSTNWKELEEQFGKDEYGEALLDRRIIYTKGTLFEPENEFRFFASPDDDLRVSDTKHSFLIVKSDLIKKAMKVVKVIENI